MKRTTTGHCRVCNDFQKKKVYALLVNLPHRPIFRFWYCAEHFPKERYELAVRIKKAKLPN